MVLTVEILNNTRINRNLRKVAMVELSPIIQYEMQPITIAGTIRRGIKSNSKVEIINGAGG